LVLYLNRKKYVHQEVQILSAWQMTSSSTLETCVGPIEDALFDNGDLTESSVAANFGILHHVSLVESHLTKSASNFQTIYKKKSPFTV
jgi:hypothetical protein